MRVNFRYSDTDFCAYLMTLGYKHTKIEVTRDKFSELKAFVHFTGVKSELLDAHEKYQNKIATCNVAEFSKNRRIIVNLIKAEVLIYQAYNM